MLTRNACISLILIAFALASGSAWSSDLAKEKRWADQIVDALIDGEAVWLDDGKSKFLGIYTENQAEKALGGVIIMHGIGVHPNWPDVVLPLRTELTNHGWTTLSIQMPILPNDADYKEYAPLYAEVPARINAAKAYLKKQGIQNIVLIGHSLGSGMATSYLAHGGSATAFVAIGLDALVGIEDTRMSHGTFMTKITIPMLDLYGSRDLDGVRDTAPERARAAAKAGNKAYTQIEVPDANHFFQGKETELVEQVSDWLANNAVK